MYRCENENRLCLEGYELDNTYSSAVSLWHSICDNQTSFRPTTPALSTLGSTLLTDLDAQYCTTVASACASASVGLSSCDTITLPQSGIGCACQPQLQSFYYTCAYMGNVSCVGVPATLTSLYGFSLCTNFQSLFSGKPIVSEGQVAALGPEPFNSLRPLDFYAHAGVTDDHNNYSRLFNFHN
jgi:hypothetical protein